jgi:hypothetical protein
MFGLFFSLSCLSSSTSLHCVSFYALVKRPHSVASAKDRREGTFPMLLHTISWICTIKISFFFLYLKYNSIKILSKSKYIRVHTHP